MNGAAAIASAVRARWPKAIVYACEYHLRQNLVAAAYADGLALRRFGARKAQSK